MKLVIAAATDVGTVRETNEDFFYYSKPGKLIVVCDGMGGHQSGAVASRIAGKTMRDIFFHADFAELARLGEEVIDHLPPLALRLVIGARLANRRLLSMASQDKKLRGMGTTLAAIAFGDNNACVVHVGDSRLYCLRGRKLVALTEDHSLVNQLLQDRDIRQDQVKEFRKKNVLTRALGTHPTLKVDAQWFPVQAADIFLLCSDGLHNALHDEQIAALLARKEADPQKMIDSMVQQAKSVNGSDNLTAVIAKIEKITGAAEKKDRVKVTLPDEAEKTITFEDKFIQEKYIIEKSRHPFDKVKFKRLWWPLFIMFSGSLLTALVLAMVNRQELFATKPPVVSQNILLPAEASKAPNVMTPPDSQIAAILAPPIGGYLAFVHASSSQQLEKLRNSPGIRLLDQFNTERKTISSPTRQLSRQVVTGVYALTVLDSLQTPIYRRNNIRLYYLPAGLDTGRVANNITPRALQNDNPGSSPNLSPAPRNEITVDAKKDTLSIQQ
jgi:protein phosphatase